MKHKGISCLDLGPIPDISCYVCANIPVYEEFGSVKLAFWLRETQVVLTVGLGPLSSSGSG